MKTEYKIRPVTRYVVTRYNEDDNGMASCTGKGEYDNADVAYEVGYALAKEEHERLGYPIGDMRIIYPQHPNELRAFVQPA
jgi:hypothetical protein